LNPGVGAVSFHIASDSRFTDPGHMSITILVRKHGPYFIHPDDVSQVRLVDSDGNDIPIPGKSITLCRCGASSKKPFCDSTHKVIGFAPTIGITQAASPSTEPAPVVASTTSVPAPEDDASLEDLLSRPSDAVVDALRRSPGDVLVLGAGGKMGPSLSRMARRAADSLGDGRRVIAVSRFSSEKTAAELTGAGIEVVRADLGDAAALAALPDAANVVYMAGQKFGTTDQPSRTWWMNTVLPALVAERFRGSRIVAFSTGNVYPLSAADGSGSRESDPLTPLGEYANSCIGRERVLEHVTRTHGTPLALIRLSYAVDLRYGVLVDIAHRVRTGAPIDVRTGSVNVIWQGDANAQALRSLPLASSPPFVVNVTGPERLRVRDVATEFGGRFGREPALVGAEAPDALLSDTSRAQREFGAPEVSAATLIDWVTSWVARGGTTLGKATGFEVRDGRF
jgi:CDGSH-type Zn-finger protein/dTDP-4-dehydrorhamnose reductase